MEDREKGGNDDNRPEPGCAAQKQSEKQATEEHFLNDRNGESGERNATNCLPWDGIAPTVNIQVYQQQRATEQGSGSD